MKKILFLLVSFFILFSCKENAAFEETASVVVSDMKMPPATKSYDKSDDLAENQAAEPKSDEISIEPKIIKNANLRFETRDLDATYDQISKSLKNQNATIQNDSQGTEYNTVFRTIIIRVPSKNFDALINEVSQGVGFFELKEITADDVTEEYIDSAARLKTKKVLETRYFELLKKASKISEIIEIEKQLSAIREEIEAKEGQLKYLQNKVSMSTITIHFYKTTVEKIGTTVSFGTKIVNAIVSGCNGISSFFIWLLAIWPFIAILVAIIYLIRRKFKKKTAQ